MDIAYVGYFETNVIVFGQTIPSWGLVVIKNPVGPDLNCRWELIPGLLGMNLIGQCNSGLFGQHGSALFSAPQAESTPCCTVRGQRTHPTGALSATAVCSPKIQHSGWCNEVGTLTHSFFMQHGFFFLSFFGKNYDSLHAGLYTLLLLQRKRNSLWVIKCMLFMQGPCSSTCIYVVELNLTVCFTGWSTLYLKSSTSYRLW